MPKYEVRLYESLRPLVKGKSTTANTLDEARKYATDGRSFKMPGTLLPYAVIMLARENEPFETWISNPNVAGEWSYKKAKKSNKSKRRRVKRN